MRLKDDRLRELFGNIGGKRIAVVGDVMLDQYYWGNVSRVSPEAPVPVVEVFAESIRLGGAANVANNIAALGAEPLLFGLAGTDPNGELLRSLLRESGFSDSGIIQESGRPTTVKTRVIAHHQHVVRFDRERTDDLTEENAHVMMESIEAVLGSCDAVILQDYNKGIFTPYLIEEVIDLIKKNGIPVTVDPKFKNFFAYREVTVFKPNRRELEEAFGARLLSDEEFIVSGKELQDKLQAENVLITRGEQGMTLIERSGRTTHLPTRSRKVADVSGAGDTVIATLTVMLASGASVRESAAVANFAGGLVCEEVGIVPVDKEKLIETIRSFDPVVLGEPVGPGGDGNG